MMMITLQVRLVRVMRAYARALDVVRGTIIQVEQRAQYVSKAVVDWWLDNRSWLRQQVSFMAQASADNPRNPFRPHPRRAARGVPPARCSETMVEIRRASIATIRTIFNKMMQGSFSADEMAYLQSLRDYYS